MSTTQSRTGRPPSSEKNRAARDITIGVRMLAQEKEHANDIATREGRSISNFIRFIYLKGLAQYEAEQARTATHA